MIVTQRDYVGCDKSSSIRRKLTNRKKKRFFYSIFNIMIMLTATVLITFISSVYFITHIKSNEVVIMPNHGKNTSNKLPPKPKERWHYIKELENSQIKIYYPNEQINSGKINPPAQLTNEQYQLLEQIQADMRYKPTYLNEIPNNNQSKVIVTDTTQTRLTTTQIPCNSLLSKQPVNVLRQISPVAIAHQPIRSTYQTKAYTHKPFIPINPMQQYAKQNVIKKSLKNNPQHWLVQCGSFKMMNQAESVHAQLAFAGIESHITTSDGWNRILLGPYSSRSIANKILQNVHIIGVSNCIPVAFIG